MRQALYRAYRPRSFDEVVGQEHITTVLKNEFKAGRPSHAYLFIGSRGTGKTTCAKLAAKAVNCLDLQEGNPCGVCRCCTGVDDGTFLDVTEIDAASNNGVDNIRELREEAVFTPASGRYRVYIIDEVHMLSISAFNALLKILEEPPEHIIFILATTEIHKVLPTIISRCQRFDFHRIETDIIAKRLEEVAKSEGISLSHDAALLIGRLSEGGMRDALSLLDVCAAHSTEITDETVSKAAGMAGATHLLTLCDAITSNDCGAMLDVLNSLLKKNLEPQRLCEQLVGHYRNLMLVKTLKEPAALLDCLPSEVPPLKEQGAKLTLAEIMHSLTCLQDAVARMSKTTQKKAELELALLSLTDSAARSDGQALIARVERLENALRKGLLAPAETTPTQPSAPEKPKVEQRADPLPEKAKPSEQKTEEPNPIVKQNQTAEVPEGEIVLFNQWQRVLVELETSNPSVAAMLNGTKAFFDGKRVLIDVQNTVLLNMLKNNEYTKSCIKQAILAATGKTLGLGPYKAPVAKKSDDPLEELIGSLPKGENIIIK